MTQELVLIPKTKYEYMLKKVNVCESDAQSGGAKEEKQSSKESMQHSDENKRQLDEIQSKNNMQTLSKSTDKNTSDLNITKAIKHRLYVQAPLSKMGFSSKQKSHDKNRKPIIKPNSKPITKANSKTRDPVIRRDSKRKNLITKQKWINYLV